MVDLHVQYSPMSHDPHHTRISYKEECSCVRSYKGMMQEYSYDENSPKFQLQHICLSYIQSKKVYIVKHEIIST